MEFSESFRYDIDVTENRPYRLVLLLDAYTESAAASS